MRKVVVSFVSFVLACGASTPATQTAADHMVPTPSAKEKFEQALARFTAHEAALDWTPATCASVATTFDQAGFAIAWFDAGVVLERCHDDAGARAQFEKARGADAKLHRASARIAIIDYRASHDLNRALDELQRVVVVGQFQDVSALVDLAVLQDKRDHAGDAEAAKANLERALAVDDGSMPALDALARHHFARARKRGNKPADVQQLELAALVASQAMEKNATYAPIYNTAGLVQNELGHTHLASLFFERAAVLDPMLFEAHMNLAELNLSYRGYATAEASFRRAIAIRPNDYDAHLGLALALRGHISGVASAGQLAAVRSELNVCKTLDGARPDAFFNDAILTQEFEAKTTTDPAAALAALDRTIAKFEEFKTHAAHDASYASAVETAAARIDDAKKARDFLK